LTAAGQHEQPTSDLDRDSTAFAAGPSGALATVCPPAASAASNDIAALHDHPMLMNEDEESKQKKKKKKKKKAKHSKHTTAASCDRSMTRRRRPRAEPNRQNQKSE